MLLNRLKRNFVLPLNPKLATNYVVSLSDILISREQRQSRQHQWLKDYSSTLVSLTVVAPGPIKDSVLTRRIFNLACHSIQSLLDDNHWSILAKAFFDLPTGAEAFITLDIPAEQVKQLMIQLENTHRVGRLWDIDVIDKTGHILSRVDDGLAARTCLLCHEDARICARQRRHTFDELIQAMEMLVDGMIDYPSHTLI